MNKRQKIVQQAFLDNEEAIIKRLKQVYGQSLKDINQKAQELHDEFEELKAEYDTVEDEAEREVLKSRMQSKVYQKQYQESLKKQVGDILDTMKEKEFTTVSDYLNKCYEEAFVGTMYDLQGQGIPLCFPLDQEAMVRAVQLDSKISQGLYSRLGEDVSLLKKKITAQVSRCIATGMSYQQMAQQLAGQTNIGFNNAVRIARTEGHRIQCQSGMDACYKAKEKGADVVKQWDSTLDVKTRSSHVDVDGEIKELNEKFSNGLMFPGDPSGRPEEVINCRCALLQRARWALGENELQTLKDRAEFFGIDKSDNFAEFRQKYIEKSNIMTLDETVKITKKGETNPSSVNAKLVNSKAYHDKFENLTEHKAVNESIYQESMRMLEHRDGTPFEDMVLLDARTGKFITGNMDSKAEGRTGLTKKQFEKAHSHNGNLVIVHNHPNSSRISANDIMTMYKHNNVSAVVAVGHDGTVHTISNLNRKVNIDKLWNEVYNDCVNMYKDKNVAAKKATSILYEMGLFKYESR